MVYPEREDVVSALRPAHDTLLHRLHRMAACDEWAIHLYSDRSAVRERIFAENPTVGRLRDARTAARPGRAYFLERQLGDALECATDQALSSLAQSAHDRLAGHAIASQVNPIPPDAELVDEVVIFPSGPGGRRARS